MLTVDLYRIIPTCLADIKYLCEIKNFEVVKITDHKPVSSMYKFWSCVFTLSEFQIQTSCPY